MPAPDRPPTAMKLTNPPAAAYPDPGEYFEPTARGVEGAEEISTEPLYAEYEV
ncbi:hypothetical protein Amsp01_021340 [Amycolatopsis sp. NBRC 101858]|uniref:hypothetical protein n=1 Tax=Amycolatopsis sp. NBRC 101858 TaxID=3032200 RepID=UPI0024A246E0|nr:hypothetical protein [Amycolatopsis sp. NBRC 101858]GLY36110.1 hypothetical protein Amsp01_021340 [Amycolatopsis sp. NBRC 101858]